MNIKTVIVVFLLVLIGIGGFYMGQKYKLVSTTQPATPTPTPLLLGGDRDAYGCIGSAGYSWCEIKQKCLRTWEEPCESNPTPTQAVDETATLIAAMKAQIVAKRGPDASSLDFTVNKIQGNYAQGAASTGEGGGMWFAAKVNGSWKLVWDGNGTILCTDLTDYPDFPNTMIPECWNETTQKSVTR